MKYHGKVGYAISKETAPSVWDSKIVERNYTGDVLKISSRNSNDRSVNTDFNILNRISIIADPFAYANFQNIVYVSWLGTLWSVKDIDVDRPRLILDIGGVYNGEQA